MATSVAKPEVGRSFSVQHQHPTTIIPHIRSRRRSSLSLLSLPSLDSQSSTTFASPPPAATKRGLLKLLNLTPSPKDSPTGNNEDRHLDNGAHCCSLKEKYGKCRSLLGKGSSGNCYVVKRTSDERTFCVKEFRKRKDGESEKEYTKKLTAEYCIGSLLVGIFHLRGPLVTQAKAVWEYV